MQTTAASAARLASISIDIGKDISHLLRLCYEGLRLPSDRAVPESGSAVRNSAVMM